MKIIKRLFFTIIFPFCFIGTLFIVSPIHWIITGEFDSPIFKLIEFYQSL